MEATAVFKTYVVDLRQRSGSAILKYVIAPAIGFALTIWLWTSLPVLAFIIGGVWVLIGLVYLAVLTRGFRTSPPVMDFSEDTPVVKVR
jgi:putrescine importer